METPSEQEQVMDYLRQAQEPYAPSGQQARTAPGPAAIERLGHWQSQIEGIHSGDPQTAVSPYPATGGPSSTEQGNPRFSDVVNAYNRDRSRASAEWQESSDRAWAQYRSAMSQANLRYEQATMEAAGRFGRAMGGLA